ncbi:uncharacterized protein LOC126798052 isoform X1 [Argentina anserina]|uniref:uncharacterized protein LOC126798052 isoform X1 n=1 Tax=Argentina anserina TaxID=57926 RepID=UPI00217691C3|nr:uncharacterized protein LOC126798052 isoform X1 [Potentilla anserina]
MDCNKEDAIKAMQRAETKMQDNDFTGARKMAQKAQQLFPGLENISQLLAVCEVHCSAENKLGGCEMDWYGILQVQRFSHVAIIKKQFKKLERLLHPDKNKFVGVEAAIKLIGEANAVLEDRGKQFIYDMKCRSLLRTGVLQSSSHQFNKNVLVSKHCDAARNVQNIPQLPYASINEHQKVQADTFCTCCPLCKTVYQGAKDSENRLQCCQRCRRLFVASDFGIQGRHPESPDNQFANHPQLHNRPNKVASNHGAGNSPVKEIQTETAGLSLDSNAGVAADVDEASNTAKKNSEHGVPIRKEGDEILKSGSVKSKDSGTSRNLNKTRRNIIESVGKFRTGPRARPDSEHVISEEAGVPSELNGGPHLCISSMKKNIYYIGNDDDDDFVNPPNWSGKSPLSSATEMKRKNAAVYGGCGSFKNDRSPDSAAAPDKRKKKARQELSFSLEDRLPSKKSKTGEPLPDNDKSNFKADVNPVANVDITSSPGAIVLPDTQFHKFALDEDNLPSLFKVNQIWALYDPADDMPRWYAFVKKVLTPGFKLEIRWLEANPDDQGDIDWCVKELPVACGKFKLGDKDELKDHLMFSHQMHYTKGRGSHSILLYPRKGETWAIYQNWDIGWSSEPEKHMPYKYEVVEVLTDFVEAVGIGVCYLGKVKGFVSLFQQTEQHGVVMFQVPPHELYRFSHQIPSFKMTGCEGHGVPPGSFELDPASLPSSFINASDLADLEMDNRSKKIETDGSSHAKVGSVTACTGMNQEKLFERETLMSRSSRESETEYVNCMKGKSVTDLYHGNFRQPKESAIPCQADKRNNTQKKHQKNDSDSATFSLRRSPRELSKNSTMSNGGMKCPDSGEDEKHVSFSQANTTSSQHNNRMQSTLKDHYSPSHIKTPVPPSTSPACRLSQPELYNFKGLKSREKFSLGQIWALYSDVNGMPNTYAQVKRIEVRPKFQVHMAVLEPCSAMKHLSGPVSCGTFKMKDCPPEVFPLSSFSHCLNTGDVSGRKVFEVKPNKGEVWALYENHNAELVYPNLEKGECEVVEVLEDDVRSTKVGVLVKVKGFKSIFKAPRIQRSKTGIIDVPMAEFHRFSHQIPAFQHTGESDSRVAGCWELDPSSIPGTVISLD